MSKGEVKNPSTDDRVKGNTMQSDQNKSSQRSPSSSRGGHTNPENQYTKQSNS